MRRESCAARHTWRRLASTAAALILLATIVAPALAQILQPAGSDLSICRVVPAGDTPGDPTNLPLPCLCPGICAAGGYAFDTAHAGETASIPPVQHIRYQSGNGGLWIAGSDGLRPWLRGPPPYT